MLSSEDNEIMCRVDRGTPMGRTLRRYWTPILTSADLGERGGDPVHVQALGENFVAFRDSDGRIGLLNEQCCHRGVSLLLARAEGCGIRCIYHGWLYGADGSVLETPNIRDPRFKSRVAAKAYPVREAGGLIWAYFGEPATEPAFPDLPFTRCGQDHLVVTAHVNNANFVQVLEGLVDATHVGILHQTGVRAYLDRDGQVESLSRGFVMLEDVAPLLEVEDTDFGFHYAALRQTHAPNDGTSTKVVARITPFIMPYIVMVPSGEITILIMPMNNEKSLFIHIYFDEAQKINYEPHRTELIAWAGLDQETVERFHLARGTEDDKDAPNRSNRWGQDRAAMRKGDFSGFPGLLADDMAVVTSAGSIRDRSREMLTSADVGVSRLYATLLGSAKSVASGGEPVGLSPVTDFGSIRGVQANLTEGQKWQSVVPAHHARIRCTPP